MPRDDSNEFFAALAVGTLVGVGAALLLRPSPRSARERLLREVGPYRRQLRHSAAEARRALEATTEAAEEIVHSDARITEDAIEVGRELLAEFREEVRRILEEAREELASLADGAADDGVPAQRRARAELEERLERRLGERGAWAARPEEDGAADEEYDDGEDDR